MTTMDPFDHRSDAGFVRAYDSRAARRQLQISILLILILAAAAIAIGLLTQIKRPAITAWSTAHSNNPIAQT
ncbi:MAG TPA: hypothetical protein VME69_15075 [Methylocella sp.]|nr:hypothetical protein [Methylocella sp.]